MSIDIKVPVLPESVTDATVATWHKQPGEPVARDENLVDIETDKVVLEVPAPSDGTIEIIKKDAGSTVTAQEVIAIFKEGGGNGKSASKGKDKPEKDAPSKDKAEKDAPRKDITPKQVSSRDDAPVNASPSVRKMIGEHDLDASKIKGTGKGGAITKADVESFMKGGSPSAKGVTHLTTGERPEKRVPMSRLRARIAERLLSAQHEAAILTTFNEVNMQPVMDLRTKYKDKFEKAHGVKLGFMSFFVKAAIEALKRFPAVNASIDGQDIVYHGFFDIGVAVSTERGLVVPVVRDADKLSMADIEKKINELGGKAREGKLSIEEMTGGTFTVSNGGIFGSLLSTPILNPPQAGILGMHKIEQRPVVENGEICVRPMMYLALSYDHRLIDGKESVQFLVTIKDMLEDPTRLLLEL